MLDQLGLSPQWLKETFLLGVDLTLDDGTPYPDALWTQNLNAAIEAVERELSIQIRPRKITQERHRSYGPDARAFWPLSVKHRPLRAVDKLEAAYGELQILTFPSQWVQVQSHIAGSMHIIPSGAGLAETLATANIAFFAGNRSILAGGLSKYTPQWFRISYRCGFDAPKGLVDLNGDGEVAVTLPVPCFDEDYQVELSIVNAAGEPISSSSGASATLDPWGRAREGFVVEVQGLPEGNWKLSWQAFTLPASIKHAIGLKAALAPLDVAGDLILGAGIANVSRSHDGLSTSIGTTSSATNAGYGARVKQFERELGALLSGLRRKWRRRNMAVV